MVDAHTVLDIGCHEGEMTALLSEKCESVVGIDKDKQNIAKAIEKQNIVYRVMDAECMWFEKETFDCVVCAEVLEHIKNPYSFLCDVYKILKKDGTLILSTPNPVSLTYLINLITVGSAQRMIKKIEKEKSGAGTEVDHIYAWGFLELYRLCKLVGFEYNAHAFAGYYFPNIFKKIGLKGELQFLSPVLGRLGADIIMKFKKG